MCALSAVFAELRSVMAPFAKGLTVKTDTDTEFHLNTKTLQKNKTPMMFGFVKINKSYVSYHLMPVYVEPALLDEISPALKARMQGKSCFNFRRIDRSLFEELSVLSRRGYALFSEKDFV